MTSIEYQPGIKTGKYYIVEVQQMRESEISIKGEGGKKITLLLPDKRNNDTDGLAEVGIVKSVPLGHSEELIGKKNILFYSYDSLTVNSKINGLLLAFDWYDNCPNGGSISSLQSPILFSIKQLHDYTCTKKIRFNSTLNIGCAADGYIGCIIVKKNTPLYFNKISLDSTSQKFKILYLNIEFNKSFCTSMSVSSLASTSNTREIKLSDYYKSSIKVTPNKSNFYYKNYNVNLKFI
jgi:hypothetical protein